ncbi:UNVERIFIED_CONTAM: hypothetical protein RMT77_002592 [Armadillidium vulgare]
MNRIGYFIMLKTLIYIPSFFSRVNSLKMKFLMFICFAYMLIISNIEGLRRVKRGSRGIHVIQGAFNKVQKLPQVLIAGSIPTIKHSGPHLDWYYKAALIAGDPYAAKEIAHGQFTIEQSDAAAANAAFWIQKFANNYDVSNEIDYTSRLAKDTFYKLSATDGGSFALY